MFRFFYADKITIYKRGRTKFLMEKRYSFRNELRGWIEFNSPDPLEPLTTGLENTERVDPLNSYTQVWQN